MTLIDRIIKNDLCLGCGLCKAMMPIQCTMRLDSRGFYRPYFSPVPNRKQIRQIARICPGISINGDCYTKTAFVWGNMKKVVIAWAKDPKIRFSSSSGGITSALAIYLLDSHQVSAVLHVGVDENDYLHNSLHVSRSREEVLKRNTSRYAPAAMFDNLVNILDTHPTDKFAFIGKPCDVAAVRNLIQEMPHYEERFVFLLAILCAGMPSYNATKDALATFDRKEDPISVRYRGDGWPGYFKASYADGTSCKMNYNDSWGGILGKTVGFRCKICPDGIGMLADIASGDAWNTKDGYPDFTESDGKNFCFIRSSKAVSILEEAEKAGYILTRIVNSEDLKFIQNPQYIRRLLVGGRIAVVQLFTRGLLHFRGLGFYTIALQGNIFRLLKDSYGTFRRLLKIKFIQWGALRK